MFFQKLNSEVKLFSLDPDAGQPTVDIFSGNKQVFQGALPDISPFLVTNERSADAFIVPHDSKRWSGEYYRYVKKASEQKTVLYFNRSDYPTNFKIPNTISLQNTLAPCRATHNCIVIPYNVKSLDFLSVREYKAPIISFVGYLPRNSLSRMIRSSLQCPFHPLKANGALVRKIGVLNLSKIKGSIVNSRTYYGGAISQIPSLITHREEFLSSIENSDFVLSPRGDANGSQRFFEAFSCGRVPVVPDTKFFLPRIIEHNMRPIYLTVKTLSTDLERTVTSFWNSLDADSYTAIQFENRRVFKEYFNYSSFLLRLLSVDSVNDLKELFVANDETRG